MKKKILLVCFLFLLFFMNFSEVLAYSNYSNSTVSCGKKMITKIPITIPKAIGTVYVVLQIAVPVLLVIFGTIDLIKAITSGKEDDIKKAQSTFLRRIIIGVLVFFVFVVVKIVISVAADKGKTSKIVSCMDCFLDVCKCTGGEKICKP